MDRETDSPPGDAPDADGDSDTDAADVFDTPVRGGARLTDAERSRLARVRRFSYAFDSAVTIPGTNVRIGLDPLLGLLPVVGDATAAAVSAYVIAEAAALGVPRATLARMCLNVLVDALVGSLPLVGDAFDAVWRANDRNVRLLEARLADPRGERRDRRIVAALGLAIFLVVTAVGVAAAAVAWWLLGVAGAV